jgi:hypothetical protein
VFYSVTHSECHSFSSVHHSPAQSTLQSGALAGATTSSAGHNIRLASTLPGEIFLSAGACHANNRSQITTHTAVLIENRKS